MARYTTEDLHQAVNQVKSKQISVRAASIFFGISRRIITKNLQNAAPVAIHRGQKKVLTDKEEREVFEWIVLCAGRGFPRSASQILHEVGNIVNTFERPTGFVKEKPSSGWLHKFLARMSSLKKMKAMNIAMASASITEVSLRAYFARIKNYLEKNGFDQILQLKRQNLNADETYLNFGARSSVVIVPNETQRAANLGPDIKKSMTVMFTACADGTLLDPFVLYPNIRLPPLVADSMPVDIKYGKNPTGWMDSVLFLEFLEKCVVSKIHSGELEPPIILWVDGHSSHISMAVCEYCRLYSIILITLFANATFILQPLDTNIFAVLKSLWDAFLMDRLGGCFDSSMQKAKFAPLLSEFLKLNALKLKHCIVEGFRDCGIVPFNPNAVNYNKLLKSRRAPKNDDTNSSHIVFEMDEYPVESSQEGKFYEIQATYLKIKQYLVVL